MLVVVLKFILTWKGSKSLSGETCTKKIAPQITHRLRGDLAIRLVPKGEASARYRLPVRSRWTL